MSVQLFIATLCCTLLPGYPASAVSCVAWGHTMNPVVMHPVVMPTWLHAMRAPAASWQLVQVALQENRGRKEEKA